MENHRMKTKDDTREAQPPQEQKVLSDEELAARVKEAEKAGLLLCMTDCEVVNVPRNG